jgi:hypothetical protein
MAQNYVLLERIELNASAASVTFSNIPQSGYTDLKIVISARVDTANTSRTMYMRVNGSSTSWTQRSIYGTGSAAGSDSTTGYGSTFLYCGEVNGSTSTTSTFTNTEVYCPNYLSSNYKSFSVDSAQENNATAAFLTLMAGLWSNTSAISTILFSPDSGNFVQYSTFSLYGLAAVGTTPAIAPKASGGNITTDGTYWIHTFLSSGTFIPATNLTCDYLVVAGGGGTGGSATSGGGGAGGLRSSVSPTGGGGSAESAISATSGTAYTITVGAGGAGSSGAAGTSGSNSIFSTITSTGGGFGTASGAAASGGSGGGGATAGAGTSGQGYAGGTGEAGGGGAGGVGQVSAFNGTNKGGAGVSNSISGTSTAYAGGGNPGGGQGNTFGGGNGEYGANSNNQTDGTVNTGGGGGGKWGGSQAGKSGGSGIVIIRYTIA